MEFNGAAPSLKIEEIVDFINKLGIKVNKPSIESGDPDTIIELYCTLLEKLGELKKEKLKINFDGMDYLPYSGMHDRPIYISNTYRVMKSFITDVLEINDFSTCDLFFPNFR